MKKPKNPVQLGPAERAYTTSLRQVAKHVGDIVRGFSHAPSDLPPMLDMLRKYSELLTPWATSIGWRMIQNVNARDLVAWKARSQTISAELRREILTAPTGETMRKLLDLQVGLIKSIPLDAAQRVQKLAIEGLEGGKRYNEMVEEIARTGQVSVSKATVIARTETSRAAATLGEARAKHIGATGYVWETSRDGAVRPSHKAMAGKIVLFTDPPTLDNLTGHAGCLPNCRCWQRIIIPD